MKDSGYYRDSFPMHTVGLGHPSRRGRNDSVKQQISTLNLKMIFPKGFFNILPLSENHTKIYFFEAQLTYTEIWGKSLTGEKMWLVQIVGDKRILKVWLKKKKNNSAHSRKRQKAPPRLNTGKKRRESKSKVANRFNLAHECWVTGGGFLAAIFQKDQGSFLDSGERTLWSVSEI